MSNEKNDSAAQVRASEENNIFYRWWRWVSRIFCDLAFFKVDSIDLMWSDVVGRSRWICNLLLLFIWMMMRKDQFKRAFSSCVFPPKCVSNKLKRWQWLRLRWQSGRFLSQRSTVQIRSLAKNLQLTCLLLVALKSRLERKSAGYGPLKIAI